MYIKLQIILMCFTSVSFAQFDQSLSNSTNNMHEEGEAHVVIDPNDSTHMIVGFMDFGGSSLDFRIYHSENSGDNWQLSTFSPTQELLNSMSNYTMIGGGDILFAYDKNSNLYCSWITFLADFNETSPLDTCLWLATWASSSDNGASFTLENGDYRFFGEGKFNLSTGTLQDIHDYKDGIVDRQWMSVDLSNGTNQNNLYVGYVNFPSTLSNTGLKVKTKPSDSVSFGDESLAYLGAGQLSNILTDQDGVLHYTFADIGQNEILHISSNDGGQTFSSTHLIYSGENLFPNANHKINERENAAPNLTIDGNNNLHLVWNDFLNSETQPVGFYAQSLDGGITWSTPINLNTFFAGNVFMPTLSSYDNRIAIGGNVLNDNDSSEYYLLLSHDNGVNFNNPIKLSSGITDFNTVGMQAFVGDYSSGTRTACSIYNLWTDCRVGNGCKQYISRYNECDFTNIIELTPIESNFSVEIYPTVTNGILQVDITSEFAENFEISVFDANGKKMLTKNIFGTSGTSETEMILNYLDSGYYLVMVSNRNHTIVTRKFIKK